MTTVSQLISGFNNLKICDSEHTQAVVSISAPSATFERILNIRDSLFAHNNSSSAIRIEVNRVPDVCEYSLLEVFAPTVLDRCQQVTFSILLDNDGNAVFSNGSSVSKEQVVNLILKSLRFESLLNPNLGKNLKAGFAIAMPQDLLLKIKDFGELRYYGLLRSLKYNEAIEILVQWNTGPNERCLIELRDPASVDLNGCNRVFLRMALHNDSTATLKEIVTPTISAEKVIEFVRKIKSLTKTSVLFYYDETVRISCDEKCIKYSLTSDRSLQVIMAGTWYERNGASASTKIHDLFFRSLLDEAYIEAFEIEDSFGSDSSLDFGKFEVHFLADMKMRCVDPNAYKSARDFLNQLTLCDLQDFFEEMSHYPSIENILKILRSSIMFVSSNGFASPETIQELLESLEEIYEEKKDPNAHKFFHIIRDCLVQHASSIYLTVANKKMISGTSLTMKIAIATQVLTNISLLDLSKEIKDLESRLDMHKNSNFKPISHSHDLQRINEQHVFLMEYSNKSGSNIVYDILFGKQNIRETYRNIYENYFGKIKDDFLLSIESGSTITSVKTLNNSNKLQRNLWRGFSNNRGIMNYMDILIPIVDWFSSITISQFNEIHPGFFRHYKHKLPGNIFKVLALSPNITIKDLFVQIEKVSSSERTKAVLDDMLKSLKKPFSDAVTTLIKEFRDSPKSFQSEERYIIWKLAKLTVEQHVMFGFE